MNLFLNIKFCISGLSPTFKFALENKFDSFISSRLE